MFKRKIESELYKYYEAKDNPKILIVYGARQIGKKWWNPIPWHVAPRTRG